MTSINEKMGFRRPGKRAFMANLPKSRAEAAKITSATCPSCHVTGRAKVSATQPGALYCTWCNTVFQPEAETEPPR